ncbi:hypothetical protein B0H13DRAFT_2515774 [Mycena leptocephala]|nr:hypothetical protein B0H13DRAFT_2515774 [Mycena leptocephala]
MLSHTQLLSLHPSNSKSRHRASVSGQHTPLVFGAPPHLTPSSVTSIPSLTAAAYAVLPPSYTLHIAAPAPRHAPSLRAIPEYLRDLTNGGNSESGLPISCAHRWIWRWMRRAEEEQMRRREEEDTPKMLFGIFATWALKLGEEIVVRPPLAPTSTQRHPIAQLANILRMLGSVLDVHFFVMGMSALPAVPAAAATLADYVGREYEEGEGDGEHEQEPERTHHLRVEVVPPVSSSTIPHGVWEAGGDGCRHHIDIEGEVDARRDCAACVLVGGVGPVGGVIALPPSPPPRSFTSTLHASSSSFTPTSISTSHLSIHLHNDNDSITKTEAQRLAGPGSRPVPKPRPRCAHWAAHRIETRNPFLKLGRTFIEEATRRD